MAERHHHVPQLILRNFASDEKLWLFDKHLSKSFRTNIKNAFVESNYNTVVGDGFKLEAEQILGRAESQAGPVIRSILERKEITHLNDQEKAHLAIFVTIQQLRTIQSRRTFKLFREHVANRFPDLLNSVWTLPGIAENEADKLASLDFIVESLSDFSQHLFDKDLILVERNCAGHFWISDHPVILHNDNPSDDRSSNLGLAVPGIQIFLPLSSSYAVAYFCPTIREELEKGLDKITKLRSKIFGQWFREGKSGAAERLALADIAQAKARLEKALDEIAKKKKIHFNKQNLIFLNSKQLQSCYRFVASPKNDFSLALDMLRQNPELRITDHISFG